MIITEDSSAKIIQVATKYLGRPFDYEKFNCVHFVREVYSNVGIDLPLIPRAGYPLQQFNLSVSEFELMPIGHSVFFKRKASLSNRVWTHVAIVASNSELIHCSRHFGGKVVVTPKIDFLQVYSLAPSHPSF
jgi:cell wall-associated NlpC family hydrolase